MDTCFNPPYKFMWEAFLMHSKKEKVSVDRIKGLPKVDLSTETIGKILM